MLATQSSQPPFTALLISTIRTMGNSSKHCTEIWQSFGTKKVTKRRLVTRQEKPKQNSPSESGFHCCLLWIGPKLWQSIWQGELASNGHLYLTEATACIQYLINACIPPLSSHLSGMFLGYLKKHAQHSTAQQEGWFGIDVSAKRQKKFVLYYSIWNQKRDTAGINAIQASTEHLNSCCVGKGWNDESLRRGHVGWFDRSRLAPNILESVLF